MVRWSQGTGANSQNITLVRKQTSLIIHMLLHLLKNSIWPHHILAFNFRWLFTCTSFLILLLTSTEKFHDKSNQRYNARNCGLIWRCLRIAGKVLVRNWTVHCWKASNNRWFLDHNNVGECECKGCSLKPLDVIDNGFSALLIYKIKSKFPDTYLIYCFRSSSR